MVHNHYVSLCLIAVDEAHKTADAKLCQRFDENSPQCVLLRHEYGRRVLLDCMPWPFVRPFFHSAQVVFKFKNRESRSLSYDYLLKCEEIRSPTDLLLQHSHWKCQCKSPIPILKRSLGSLLPWHNESESIASQAQHTAHNLS